MMTILSKPVSCLAVMLSLAAVLATTVTIEAADGADKKKARKKVRKKVPRNVRVYVGTYTGEKLSLIHICRCRRAI